jgi:hypothetical protein
MDTLNENFVHFDIDLLKTRLGNNEIVFKQLIELIKTNINLPVANMIQQLRASLAQKDTITLHSTAHKLKGTALSSCFTNLAELASTIEKEEGLDADAIETTINDIVEEVELIKQILP